MSEEKINGDELLSITPEEFTDYCESYGDLNPKAIEYLRQNYDTYQSKQAFDLVKSVAAEAASLSHEIEQVCSAAKDIIDGDPCGWETYDLEEHGELSGEIDHVREQLFDLESKLQTARIWLAPLERLAPVDDETETQAEDGMLVSSDENVKPLINEYWFQ